MGLSHLDRTEPLQQYLYSIAAHTVEFTFIWLD